MALDKNRASEAERISAMPGVRKNTYAYVTGDFDGVGAFDTLAFVVNNNTSVTQSGFSFV